MIEVYHHDPVEVDTASSWTGLCNALGDFTPVAVQTATDPTVLALFEYARPDAVVVVDGQPVVSLEQTMMNPSGHNIPQRFSCLVRAAELGVPSIMYCPEAARRTFSDPNPRYIQVRVPLGQLRLTRLYGVPSLTVFWPTGANLLPRLDRDAHQQLADVIAAFIEHRYSPEQMMTAAPVRHAFDEMIRVSHQYGSRYRQNNSVRALLPSGFPACDDTGLVIDPANTARVVETEAMLQSFGRTRRGWSTELDRLAAREHTLYFTGTANAARNDSEHPWPGYLTLLDILYLRTPEGTTTHDRTMNLVYRLPNVDTNGFVARLNLQPAPTAARIADNFADALILDGGLVPGRPARGPKPAGVAAEP